METIKYLLIYVLIVGFSATATAQTEESDSARTADNKPKIFEVVDQMPSFPGGQQALFVYLSNHIRYPAFCEDKGIQGRVIVKFVVEKDGSLSDINVTKSVHPFLDKEAVRVISGMPRWIPGRLKSGETIRVKYTIPVTFRLK